MTRALPRYIFLTDQTAGLQSELATPRRVVWRLLAANNRVLGRSATVFPSLEVGFEAARSLSAGLASALYTLAFRESLSRWTWTVTIDGEPCAVAAHLYQRRIACLRGVRQFLLLGQRVGPNQNAVRLIGSNAFGSYGPIIQPSVACLGGSGSASGPTSPGGRAGLRPGR